MLNDVKKKNLKNLKFKAVALNFFTVYKIPIQNSKEKQGLEGNLERTKNQIGQRNEFH